MASQLQAIGTPFDYEERKFRYSLIKTYKTDFAVHTLGGDVMVEVKGWFPTAERTKIKSVLRDNPDLRLLVALQRPNAAITRDSKTTLAMWCEKNSIPWCPCPIPEEILAKWKAGIPFVPSPVTSPAPAADARKVPPATQTDIFTALHVSSQ